MVRGLGMDKMRMRLDIRTSLVGGWEGCGRRQGCAEAELCKKGIKARFLLLFPTFQTQLLPQMRRKKTDNMWQSSHPLAKNF